MVPSGSSNRNNGNAICASASLAEHSGHLHGPRPVTLLPD
jgi:hypothetical protein